MPRPPFAISTTISGKTARRFSRLSKDFDKDVREAALKVASFILRDAKKLAPVRTGALRRSGRIEPPKPTEVSIAFGGRGTGVDYAPFVEFGRAPGKMPPVDELRTWAARATGDEGNAFVIARVIAARGVAPTPFLRPALLHNRDPLLRLIKANIRRSWDAASRRP